MKRRPVNGAGSESGRGSQLSEWHRHGGPQTTAELQQRMMNTAARQEKMKELVAQHKSLEEIKKELGEPRAPSSEGGFPSSPRSSTRSVPTA